MTQYTARRVARARTRVLLLLAAPAVAGCFATRNDVRIVQTDIASMRAELLRNDAERKEALTQLQRTLAAASDSLNRINARIVSLTGDVRGETRAIKEQLLQLQTLLGQSQSTITRLRAEIEARNNAFVPSPPPLPGAASGSGAMPPAGGTAGSAPTSSTGGGTPATGGVPPIDSAARGPGPTQLYQNGLDQLNRGSTSTARVLFQELLTQYPSSDLAPDAQARIALSLERENNRAAADVAYGAVLAKYPESRQAPNALYKRAQIALQLGNKPEAKKYLEDLVRRYPKSSEAEIAAEQLKDWK